MPNGNLGRLFDDHPELTQVAIAEAADISQSHLSLLIAGLRSPSLTVASRLTAVLREQTGMSLTIEWLFGSEELPTASNE